MQIRKPSLIDKIESHRLTNEELIRKAQEFEEDIKKVKKPKKVVKLGKKK